jgi:hypothetical protein
MTVSDGHTSGDHPDPEELAAAGGVGIGAGAPSTFEPEEDPEAVVDAAGPTSPDEEDGHARR